MGARSGNNYLSALRRLKADLWLDGEHIADPTIHPALVKRARALASLYDRQAEHPAAMTYRLDDGSRAGFSFVQAESAEAVRQRGAMFRHWAAQTGGAFLTPDRHNGMLAAFAAQSLGNDPQFAENLRVYYAQARARDWCTAQTLGRVTANAAEWPEAIVIETPNGLLISGRQPIDALGPFAEELFILPNGGAASSTLVFAINCNASDLRIECRRTSESGEEINCAAMFDRVLIPWSRIFFRGDSARWKILFDTSDAPVSMLHYDAVRSQAQAESILESVASRSDAGDLSSAISREVETIRTEVLAAESNAHRGQSGQFVPAREPLEDALHRFVAIERQWAEVRPG